MSRLLKRPAVAPSPRLLGAPDAAPDPFVRERVQRAAAEAYERGVADGRRMGEEEARGAAERAAERMAGAVREAGAVVLAELADLRSAQALADVELACRIAEAVVGHEPHDGGQALLERCREAIAALDDTPLTVHVNTEDAQLLAGALHTNGDVRLVEDASLAPGEARIRGSWGRADLTRDAAWALVRESLGVGDA